MKLLFLIPPVLSGAFIINLCALVYRCGCRSWWSGAAVHCNIHAAGMRHCPLCSHGAALFYSMTVVIAVPQIVLAFRPAKVDWRLRLLLAAAAFPIIGLIAMVILGIADRYWTA